MHDGVSDEALMAAYVAGDERAFQQLFQRTAPSIHAFFMRSFAEAAVADDLMQTTFFKMHRARGQWRSDRRLRPWLFSIAARVRIDELRRRYGLREDASPEAVERAADEAQPASAEDEAERADVAAAVQAALARLPESQRVVVHLHRFAGLTFAEIGAILGASEGAVKLRAFRAYSELRRRLNGLL
jgi:RNA polymerase sigma-70 factor (ECF subfamily)